MEEDIKYTILYDIYGKLLTKKQQDIFKEYFLYNLSLREIAENKKISYQAVRDSIEKSKKMLDEYDDILNLKDILEKNQKINNLCKNNKNIESKKILEVLEK